MSKCSPQRRRGFYEALNTQELLPVRQAGESPQSNLLKIQTAVPVLQLLGFRLPAHVSTRPPEDSGK